MKKLATTYYLRDLWVSRGQEFWVRRPGEYKTKADALSAAKVLAVKR